jgi:hypothetical protein
MERSGQYVLKRRSPLAALNNRLKLRVERHYSRAGRPEARLRLPVVTPKFDHNIS